MPIPSYNADQGYSVFPAIISHRRRGLGRLSHDELRRRLADDMQRWLEDGHQMTQLPHGVADQPDRRVRFTSLFDRILGFRHETG